MPVALPVPTPTVKRCVPSAVRVGSVGTNCEVEVTIRRSNVELTATGLVKWVPIALSGLDTYDEAVASVSAHPDAVRRPTVERSPGHPRCRGPA